MERQAMKTDKELTKHSEATAVDFCFMVLENDQTIRESDEFPAAEGLQKLAFAEIRNHWNYIKAEVKQNGVFIGVSGNEDFKYFVSAGEKGISEGQYKIRCFDNIALNVKSDHLFHRNLAGVYEISLSGQVKRCNQAFAEILGFDDPSEVEGTDISSFYYNPTDRVNFLKNIQENKELHNFEILLKRRDGSIAWCIENSYLIRDQSEELIAGTLIDVTEQRLANEKYGQLFKESTDAIIILEGTKIIDCNKRLEGLLGISKEEFITLDAVVAMKEFIEYDSRKMELFEHKINKVLQGEKQRIQLLAKRRDGGRFHAEMSLAPFVLLDRMYVQVIVHDISERVLFETTIRESEERFRMISKVAIEGVVFSEAGKIVDCNDQFARMMGFRVRKDVIARNIRDFINPYDLDRLQRTAELPSPNRLEVRARNESGDTMVLESSGSQINVNGKLLDAYLLYDITSRKKTEQALEQSMDRFKGLVENSPNGVFIITDGKVRYANYSGLKLLGYTDEDDVFNVPFVDFFKSKSKKYLSEDLEMVRQGEDVDFRELIILDRHKSEIEVGIKMILTVYDNKPSIQITINNLQTERLLIQEKLRAQLAEEINAVLKHEIEEHKETQRKLTTAENFTRNIIESSLDMIIAVDRNSIITEFNRSAQANFGIRSKDAIGRNVKTLFANDSEYNRVLSMLETRGFYSGEILNKRKSGEEFHTFLSASLIRTTDGEVIGSMGVSRDITELKRAEQELRNSEERYRDIFDNASDFIVSINKAGKVEYSNNAFQTAMGYDAEELKDISINSLCESHKTTKAKSVFKVFDGNLTTTWITKTGEKIIAQGTASAKLKNGKPDSIRAIFRNITGELAQRAKLESLFNSTENILIWTVDKKLRITSFNINFQQLLHEDFGITIKEGDNLLKKLEPVLNVNLYQGQLESYDQAFLGRARQFEIPLINSEGQTVWLQSFLNPVYYADKLEEVSCISYDVTERKAIDRKIRDALKEKEVLLQEVHHRVKNNLQVISSILNLQSGYVKDEKTLEILKESQDRIKSMSFIHETLYQTADFSSIEFPDYINTLSRSLIHSYITDKPVLLETEFDEVYLGIDQAIPCGLIVNELVSNALKYAYKGVKDPKLKISIHEVGGKITLRVKDNGIGLPADFKYQESDSLGIQLVYTLTDQLDGAIEMNNNSGADIIVTFDKAQPK